MYSSLFRPAVLCAAFALTSLNAQDFVVTTVAGGALPATPAPGVSVSVHYPRALFVDNAGNTYFTLANAVLKLDKSGVLTRFAGSSSAGYSGDGGPATSAQLYYPFSVTADSSGNVYIADLGNYVVRKVASNGIITTYAGTGEYGSSGDGGVATQSSLGYLGGVAVDLNGNLYIGDTAFNKIRKVAPDGTISSLAGGGVNSPSGLACDGSGNVYVADGAANVIREVTPQGASAVFAGTGAPGYAGDEAVATNAQLSNPSGVSVDSAGNVYIADTGNNVVRMVDTSGVIHTVAGDYSNGFTAAGDGGPATAAGLYYPEAAAADSDGNLYICDLGNNRIRKVTTDNIIRTAVGGGATSSGDGGLASAAQLNGPSGVAADGKGNLYIADALNNRVRKVASDGTITTIAGNGVQGSQGDGGSALKAQFNQPWAVAADEQGNVFIADFKNNEVRKVDSNGKLTEFTSTHTPSGLAFDVSGNLYVAQYDYSQVWKFSATGAGSVFAGVEGSYFASPHYGGDGGSALKASFSLPGGLAADAKGNLYIADTGNQRVRMISSSGVVSTVAGNGTAGFSGDGGRASQSQLNYPSGVAVDPAGNLYIADTNNHRIRMVDSSGKIRTVAGGYGYAYSGDGGLATKAVFDYPVGIAADANGNLFIADQYDSVVRMLAPAHRAPILAVTEAHFGPAIAGQSISSSVTVSNSALAGPASSAVNVVFTLSPALTLTSAGGSGWSCVGNTCTRKDGLAAGSAFPAIRINATLAGGASGQLISSAVVSGGGALFSANAEDVMDVVSLGASCSYALDSTGADLSPAAAHGTVKVSTGAGCPWNAAANQSWIGIGDSGAGAGSGSVSYSVDANPGAARTAALTIAGQSFSIRQAGSESTSLSLAGALAHFASGAGWASTITVLNTAASPVQAAVSFYDDNGSPVSLPATFPQTPAQARQQVATWDQTLGANALAVLDTRQGGEDGQVGSAQLRGGAGVSGFEVFANLASGQQAAVPLETRNAPSYLLAFDNTGQLNTGLAIANVSGTQVQVNVIIRDDTGNLIGNETEQLNAYGHDYFMLSKWSETKGKRGTVEFDTPSGGRITVLGLRVNGQALTTLPVLAGVASGGGSLAHFASGGGWQTTFTFANTGTSVARFTLKFYDRHGALIAVPLSSPEMGDLGALTTVDAPLQPGASVQLVTYGNPTQDSQIGSARLDSTGPVSGFSIFRTDAGQEAVVPLETRQGSFVLAFDNANGLATGCAIANFSVQAAPVNVIVRDDTGTQIGSHIEQLDARGHDSFTLSSTWPETSGKRGTVEFAPPASASIGVIGIRVVSATGVVTTIPVVAK